MPSQPSGGNETRGRHHASLHLRTLQLGQAVKCRRRVPDGGDAIELRLESAQLRVLMLQTRESVVRLVPQSVLRCTTPLQILWSFELNDEADGMLRKLAMARLHTPRRRRPVVRHQTNPRRPRNRQDPPEHMTGSRIRHCVIAGELLKHLPGCEHRSRRTQFDVEGTLVLLLFKLGGCHACNISCSHLAQAIAQHANRATLSPPDVRNTREESHASHPNRQVRGQQ